MAVVTKTGLMILLMLAGILATSQSVFAQQRQFGGYANRAVAYGNSAQRGARNGLAYVYRGATGGRPNLNGTSTNTMSYRNHSPTGMRNGLPPTSMDSFVLNAGSHKEHIYGDEGANGIPPYFGFNHVHRINTGIEGDRDTGLTTGHGSYLPEAWGADEYIAPPGEWSQSGVNNGDHQYNHAADALDAAATAQGTTRGGAGRISEADLAQHPSPGEGYQPMFQHGVFVGWWSPSEIALAQKDFKNALRSIMASDRFWGDAYSIRVEIGDLPWP